LVKIFQGKFSKSKFNSRTASGGSIDIDQVAARATLGNSLTIAGFRRESGHGVKSGR
jgi:hypothetical protein